MAILVEPQAGNMLARPGASSNVPPSCPTVALDMGESAVHDTEANDEVDEDEEDLGHHEQTAPELLSEVMIRSGYLLKRGDKRKVRA